MKANKKYTQTVKKAFHLSTASLDTSSVKAGDDIQVLVNSDDNNFLLCTLNKDRVPQWSLDLNFAEGDKLTFSIKGEGLVHLTGFLIPDGDDEFLEDLDEEEENEVMKKLAAKAGKAAPGKKTGAEKLAAAVAANDSDDDDSDDDDDEDESLELEDAAPGAEGSDDDEDAEEEEDSDDDEDGEEEVSSNNFF